jgi:hypothetical protein
MAVDICPLAVQAGPRTDSDFGGEALPDIPGGNEAAGGVHTWVSGAVQVFEHVPAEIYGDQGVETSPRRCRRGGQGHQPFE